MKEEKTLKPLLIGVTVLVYLVIMLNHYLGWQLFGLNPMLVSMVGIFVTSLLLWLFVAIDWPSLLCILGMSMLPGVGFNTILPLSFGNVTFAFLLFTFLLTYALDQTFYIKRLTAWAVHSTWAQSSPWRLVIAFLCIMLLIASFISPTILFMIAYPLYEELCAQLGLEKGNRNAGILLVALYTTIAIGTAMTPINHVFAISAIGLYEAAFNQTISYYDYMKMAVPAGFVIFLVLLLTLRFIWRLSLTHTQSSKLASLAQLPEADKREKGILGVFLVVVAMWLLPEVLAGVLPGLATFFKTAGIAFPPLFGIVILAILSDRGKPLLDVPKAMREGVHWPSLLLVAATLSLGAMIAKDETGIVPLLNELMTPVFSNLSAWMIVFIFVVWAGLQTNLSSNLVTVSVVSAIALALAQSNANFPANSAIIACFIGFMASIALMTPPAMPYVAISVGNNWVTSRQAFTYGLWILVISILAMMFVAYPIGLGIF
ncbi:TPA: SLC13 family permease [Streptococcus suis]